MIKAYTNNGTGDVQVEGEVSTLYSDTMIIIKTLYNRLKKDNPECAELYKMKKNMEMN